MVAASQVRAVAKARFDSGYFARRNVELAARVADLPGVALGAISSSFRKGIFDIAASSYVEESGVPFVRVGDLRNGLLDPAGLARISFEAHSEERKTALHYGDLILSKTAYPAAALVTVPECNVSQDTIAVSLSDSGRQRFKAGYIVAYLNSDPGRALMGRLFQGNVQEHLGLAEAADLLIPELDLSVQTRIERLIEGAERERASATASVAQAESDLLDALGLRDWSSPEPLTYTRSAADVFAAGRLDAEFAAPRIQSLLRHLDRDGATLGSVTQVRREKFKPKQAGEIDYIEIGDLDGYGRVRSSRIEMAEAPSRATWFVRPGDVITSTVRPIRRLTAIVAPEQDGFVCSSGFVVLQPVSVSSELVLTYLRLPIVAELLHLFSTASMYPALAESDLLALPMPPVPGEVDRSVQRSVERARDSLARSERSLTAAKRAVEIAIEEGEAATLAFIAQAEAPAPPP